MSLPLSPQPQPERSGSFLSSTVSFLYIGLLKYSSLPIKPFSLISSLNREDLYLTHFNFPKTQGLEQSRRPVCLLQARCPAPEAWSSAGEATFMENEGAGEQSHPVCRTICLQKPGDKGSGGLSWWKWHLQIRPPLFVSSPGSGPNVPTLRSPLCSQRKLSPSLAPFLSRELPAA